LIGAGNFLAKLNQVGISLEIVWQHKIKLDWSWKFLGDAQSKLNELRNSLAAQNQI
jgi:hypothetical protein